MDSKLCGGKHEYERNYGGTFNGSLESNPRVELAGMRA